jgi:hypothetical protein
MILHRASLSILEATSASLPGQLLHRAGLTALHAGAPELADRWFELAAAAYRREIRTESLARLRVHQSIARYRLHRGGTVGMDPRLSIEHALCRLERIEALEPPFADIEARTLLARWPESGMPAPRAAAA